jgi:hypothetical protein
MLRQVALEALEPRTLLSTLLPPSVLQGSQSFISYNGDGNGNESSPTIAVDPLNPNKMVAAWVLNNPKLAPGPTVFVQAAYSSNGGNTWSSLFSEDLIRNPTATSAPIDFTTSTDPSVAFDHNEHIYVLESQQAGSSGALVLNTFDFSGNLTRPTTLLVSQPVYQWVMTMRPARRWRWTPASPRSATSIRTGRP